MRQEKTRPVVWTRQYVKKHGLILPFQPIGPARMCWANVDKQIAEHGGTLVAGYMVWEMSGAFYSDAHAVWRNQEGELIDVTEKENVHGQVGPDYFVPGHGAKRPAYIGKDADGNDLWQVEVSPELQTMLDQLAKLDRFLNRGQKK